jgi:hypothetical protein
MFTRSIIAGLLLSAHCLGQSFLENNIREAKAKDSARSSITVGSPCTVGDVVCAGDSVGQCPQGTIVAAPCNTGLQCRILPLQLRPGTTVACTTKEDADRRFQQSPSPNAPNAAPAPNPPASTPPSGSPGTPTPPSNPSTSPPANFLQQNKIDARQKDSARNSIAPGSACTGGDVVCAGDLVGQCANGAIVTTACNTGLKCRILPLQLRPGTTVSCTTDEDAARRLA